MGELIELIEPDIDPSTSLSKSIELSEAVSRTTL